MMPLPIWYVNREHLERRVTQEELEHLISCVRQEAGGSISGAEVLDMTKRLAVLDAVVEDLAARISVPTASLCPVILTALRMRGWNGRRVEVLDEALRRMSG